MDRFSIHVIEGDSQVDGQNFLNLCWRTLELLGQIENEKSSGLISFLLPFFPLERKGKKKTPNARCFRFFFFVLIAENEKQT